MDKVYEELDEAKAEIERLKTELRAKTDSLENIKKSHNAQVNQIQEAKYKAEKLDQELLQKADEITETKQAYEDLKVNLDRKQSIIKDLSAANEKLRVDSDENFKKWEEEKRGLVLALEEANEKAENQEQQVYVCRQEIENLKGLLSVSKTKCLEIEKHLKASKERSERDEMFYKLEEEYRKVEDQLKWKKEQFKHLEQAHEKLRDQFKSSKKEWEIEKSTLLDEISSLQIKLDSQTRISEDLQHQLQTCHQALAHVESQKKRLEVEVSDFKVRFDNASSEYQDARLQLDCLNSQHDRDIADLRYSLKTKEVYYKELKYGIEKLEQENQELKISIRELQEAQIQEAGASYSHSKLRSKLRNLEQAHKECASILMAKEAEWNFQLEQSIRELNACQSEMDIKIAEVENLKMELERSHSSTIEMMLLNEEMSVMLLVLKQGISEAQLKLANHKDEIDRISREKEEKCFQLIKELEIKDAALISVQKEINEERERAACLARQVETLEFSRHKEMLEESTRCQILKEKVMQMEYDSKEQLEAVLDALDNANVELHDRICERNEMELELQIWKSIAERLKNDIDENHHVRRELEAALLAQVDDGESLKQAKDRLVYNLEEKERIIYDLQQRILLLEQEKQSSGDSGVSSESDTVSYLHIIQEKDKILEELREEVATLEQEVFRREFETAVVAESTMEKTYAHDKENLIQLRVKELNDQMETKLRKSDGLIQELKMENRNLLENSARLSERENLLRFVQGLGDKVCEFSTADTELMETLRSMVQSFENDSPGIDLKKYDGFQEQENTSIHSPRTRIKTREAFSDIRSPFKELNH